MKILVIDDTQAHLDAATQTLSDHEVVLCSSYDEALKLLEQKRDEEKFERLYKEYAGNYRKATDESLLPYWDAVLCDLLMPAGKDAQGDKGYQFIGKEMPVGWSLALVAASRGAKYVAVVSDTGHHDHPASAMLDRINNHIFNIDDARVLLTNRIRYAGIVGTESVCPRCNGTLKVALKNADGTLHREVKCDCFKGIVHAKRGDGKHWGEILSRIIEPSE